jgi:hypothetical protein
MVTNTLGIAVVIIAAVIIAAPYIWWLRRRKLKVYYFLPHRVVFQINHPPIEKPEDAENIKDRIVTALQSFLGDGGKSSQQGAVNATSPESWRNKLDPPTPESIITFPSFSLVPVHVSGYDEQRNMDPKEVKTILRDAYADLAQNNVLDLGDGLAIQSISPDWLMGGLHHGGATGGPGGRPKQASIPQSGAQSFRVYDGAMKLLPDPPAALAGANAVVAILDTAPTAEAIVRASHDWVDNPSVVDHPLVKDLFGANGSLTIHRASPATQQSLEHYSLVLHDYLMPDHGTAIAGMIRQSVQGADLHLYEVLNRYGVGTFTSVAQGISEAISTLGRPLIINCSFMFCLPDGEYGPKLAKELDLPIEDLEDPASSLTQTIRQVFEGIVDPNITIVASAGNDSLKKPQRVGARFPAAFKNVIGVGALRKGNGQNATSENIPASYSNCADEPPANGYMTLGGESGADQGIRVMYISDFPERTGLFLLLPRVFFGDERINRTGWAWWSGTSFATALISGLLAARWSGPLRGTVLNYANARTELANHIQPNRTSAGEPVIYIEQG